nr:serine protease [uncultured Desulfobacter sp.]
MLNENEKTLLFSTVRIEVENSSMPGASVGTGFIVSIPVPGIEGKSYLFLVSNKHVFIDPGHQISLIFTKKRDGEVDPSLGELSKISQFNFSKGYVEHPDSKIDLACVNLSSFGEPELNLYFRHYPHDQLGPDGPLPISVGQEVFFIGYPENRFDVVHNLPLLRKGCIASAPNIDFNGEKQFLIDAHVFQGSSGSPVLAAVNGEYKIIGVISQTMIKNSMVQAIPVGTAPGVQQFIGLGITLKVNLVHELLEHAANQMSSGSI